MEGAEQGATGGLLQVEGPEREKGRVGNRRCWQRSRGGGGEAQVRGACSARLRIRSCHS